MFYVVMLPGMDGTSELFQPLLECLPEDWELKTLSYPRNVVTSYSQLLKMLESAAPQHPFVLIAESYSSPLAIQYAATSSPNLKGLILCAGFASCPVGWFTKVMIQALKPILFRLPLSDFLIRGFLTGSNTDVALLTSIRTVIKSVAPGVLSARLTEVLRCDVLYLIFKE